jgi:2-oxoisovalerate dehydrogenase E1 component alpha subunit
MFRSASRRLLSSAAPVGLDQTISSVEGVWNMKFGGKPTTHTLNFNDDPNVRAAPMYHILSLDGKVDNKADVPDLSKELCEKIMHTMVKQNMTDRILLEAQRQGRISFYMTAFGEEAAITGSAAGLAFEDEIFLQYRETGVLTYRGYTISQMIAQCMGNLEDPLKGRQMPIHYGSRELNVQMVSSPLGTQIPHAAGAGYAFKLEGKKERICVCYFGEGAASEGDFHAGMNFASTVGAHTLFFVRNNGFAISTSTVDQYRGDGILPRGIAYGIPSVRVDGNDVLAVLAATRKARSIILERDVPVLVEAMSYRVGHHSTSDDSTAYRSKEEIAHFDTVFSPISRFGNFLKDQGWWSDERTTEIQKATREECLRELKRHEKVPVWPIEELFADTYESMTPNLIRQKKQTMEHYAKNRSIYDHAGH